MSVRQAAEALGVHYMTAYRYVRARSTAVDPRNGGIWIIRRGRRRRVPRRDSAGDRAGREPAGAAPAPCGSGCLDACWRRRAERLVGASSGP